MRDELVLEMREIDKIFPGVHALKKVNFELRKGEVHALLGENGAGKSTLINVLGGVYPIDGGQILIDGQPVVIRQIKDAQQLGIAIIHQELVLVPHMTVAENIFMGREPRTKLGTVDKKKMFRDAQEAIDAVGLCCSATDLVCKLSVAQQQLVEIAKALSYNAKIVVMDEPTSSLMTREVDILFDTIRKLRAKGVSIIYISHRMSEFFEIADRITVMRDGEYVTTRDVEQTNTDELVFLMVGRKLENYYTRTYNKPGETVLEVSGLSQKSTGLEDINFSLRKGEILGFSGLVGAGRSELMRCIVGIEKYDSGEIRLFGEPAGPMDTAQAQKKGLVMVPEDRKQQGLILLNSVGFNLTINVLESFIGLGVVNKCAENEIIERHIRALNIKTPSARQKVGNLSGGNQQKVLMGKWLATNPKILILDEPTRGVDVGAKAEIYMIIDRLAKEGISVIMVSSELNEIINMCDRVLVMSDGRITGELDRSEFTQELIMSFATTMKEETAANG
ncbi:MAG: sugar ABC transporter ATP-binding protein [Christensenellales bacterium]